MSDLDHWQRRVAECCRQRAALTERSRATRDLRELREIREEFGFLAVQTAEIYSKYWESLRFSR